MFTSLAFSVKIPNSSCPLTEFLIFVVGDTYQFASFADFPKLPGFIYRRGDENLLRESFHHFASVS